MRTYIALYKFSPYRFDPENEGAIRTDELRFVMSNLPVKLTDKVSNF